ncbi:sulfite exporter TauE/SafE family protein [bacterium]|nr:sulfite exporter TauE/SafE family protein [bacterium]
MITVLLVYLVVGAIAGVLAGLLGIGGGLIIVPMMVFTLNWQGIPHELVMHLALGSSMASIIFTSISSFRAHHKRGAVHWDVVRRIVLGIFAGTFLGTTIASRMGTDLLKGFFVIFIFYVAIQMLTSKKPKPSRQIPGNLGMFGVGSGIGVVSALVGIGGGTLSVPFMVWCNLPVHHAIGTSAAIGFPIAIAGTIGYIFNGWGNPTLPAFSLGYIYLPAVAGIACASVLTAPLGVRLAHRLPVDKLKKVFAILLMLVGTRMLVNVMRVVLA